MNILGYKKLIIVVDLSSLSRHKIIEVLKEIEGFSIDRIVKQPWNPENMLIVDKVPEIDSKNDVYTIFANALDCKIHSTFYKELVAIEYLVENYERIPLATNAFIEYKEYTISIFLGFEIDIFIDNYEKSINDLLSDKSQYPIYAFFSETEKVSDRPVYSYNGFCKYSIKDDKYNLYLERIIDYIT